jgi:hypothetical protein
MIYHDLYALHDKNLREKEQEILARDDRERKRLKFATRYDEIMESLPALEAFVQVGDLVHEEAAVTVAAAAEALSVMQGGEAAVTADAQSGRKVYRDGFERMRRCRMALDALDQGGWKRSYHQRLFHEAYIAACARPFWKIDQPGAFAKAHQKILDLNSWENLAQEILISTPRRFGKTISVSMFAAALMFSCAGCEVSIYSTCKRISTKLLRNVTMFLGIIYDVLKCDHLRIIRSNQEEVHLQGDEGYKDVRIIQSYPSKVRQTGPIPLPQLHFS